jgi:hypothetical protein
MGQKKAYTLLDGVTVAGASTAQYIGNYQKGVYVEVHTTAGVPAFTIQIQYKNPKGVWQPYHEEVVDASTDDPLIVTLKEFPWAFVRVEITAYTTGTVDAFLYAV